MTITVSDLTKLSPARAATNAAIALSGLQVVDGVSLAVGDRVLVKNQSSGAANGIYVAASSSWSRASDFDSDAEVINGAWAPVTAGTQAGDWMLVTPDPITVGSTALSWQSFVDTAADDLIFRPKGAPASYYRTVMAALDDEPRSIHAFGHLPADASRDCTAQINQAIAAGVKSLHFPPGEYRVSGAIAVPSGMRISGSRGAVIRQQVQGITFDAFGADNVEICDLAFVGDYTRSAAGNTGFRGDQLYSQACAIWINGERCAVRNVRVEGMVSGVCLSCWINSSSGNVAGRRDNVVENIQVENVQFGVTLKGQENARLSGLTGRTITLSPSSVDPQHLVYITGGPSLRSNTVVIADATVVDCPGASAIQCKWTDGLVISNLAVRSSGLLTMTGCTDVTLSNFAGRDVSDMGGVGGISIFMQDNAIENRCLNVVMSNFCFDMADGSTRAMSIGGDHLVGRAISFDVRRSSQSSAYDVTVCGFDIDLELTARSATEFGGNTTFVRAITGPTGTLQSDDVTLRVTARNSNAYLYVDSTVSAGASIRLHYDPAQSTSTNNCMYNASSALPVLRPDFYEIVAAKPSATFVIGGLKAATRFRLEPGAAGWGVAAPAGSSAATTPPGTDLEMLIINSTSATLGAATWDPIYVFRTGFVAPATGKAVRYVFRYNGSNWVEL